MLFDKVFFISCVKLISFDEYNCKEYLILFIENFCLSDLFELNEFSKMFIPISGISLPPIFSGII